MIFHCELRWAGDGPSDRKMWSPSVCRTFFLPVYIVVVFLAMLFIRDISLFRVSSPCERGACTPLRQWESNWQTCRRFYLWYTVVHLACINPSNPQLCLTNRYWRRFYRSRTSGLRCVCMILHCPFATPSCASHCRLWRGSLQTLSIYHPKYM